MLLCLFPAVAAAEPLEHIPLTEDYFPDANFRAWILAQDGWTEAEDGVTYLSGDARENEWIDCSGQGIEDLTGIGFFPNLRYLFAGECYEENENGDLVLAGSNALTTFDPALTPNLVELSITLSDVTELDVSSLTNLERLWCGGNGMTSLTLGNLPHLEYLNAGDFSWYEGNDEWGSKGNMLSELDLSGVPNLKELNVNGNLLTALDASGFADLERLECANNPITSLTMPDHKVCGWVGLCEVELTDNGNGTWSFDLSTLLDSTAYSFESIDTSEWGESKTLNPETGVVTFAYRPNWESFCVRETIVHDEDWKEDLSIDLRFGMPNDLEWTVIGSIFGTCWNTDFQMIETEPGVWQSGAWALHEGEEFKVRGNCDWSYNYGTDGKQNGANCVVEADGVYIITLNRNHPVTLTWALTDRAAEEPVIVQQSGGDDPYNPDDPTGSSFHPKPADDDVDPATAFNFASDNVWIPDQSEWPEAPAYEGELDYVPIDEAHFPDEHFRAWILGENGLEHSSTEDGDFFTGEQLWNVTVICCPGQRIESLAGIEYFPNLEWLYCGRTLTEYVPEHAFFYYISNPIAALDLSHNPKLTRLYANYCNLETIDLSANPALTRLNLFYNELTELDLSSNPYIEELNIAVNDIEQIELSALPDLKVFCCGFTRLVEVDLSGRSEMTSVRCHNIDTLETLNINGCTSLDPTECEIHDNYALRELRCRNCGLSEIPINISNLKILDCGENEQFTSLDLSDYRELKELYCDNCSLYRLDISVNRKLETVDCSGNHLKKLNFELNSSSTHVTLTWTQTDQSPEAPVIATAPDDPNETVWTVIGSIHNTSWDADFQMTETAPGVWQSGAWELHANEEFKVRANCDWNENFGLNGEPGGPNCVIAADGTYIITLNLAAEVDDGGAGCAFYGNGQTAVTASGMEADGEVYTFDMTDLVSAENLDRILSVENAEYDPQTGIATFETLSDTLAYTYRTQPDDAADPCPLSVTVTLNVEMPDLPDDAIPIDKAHFPDDNFRNWILKSLTPYYTEDAFGRQYLTDEREGALYFSLEGLEIASIEGLQYFPNAFGLFLGDGYRQDENGEWVWHSNYLTDVDLHENTNLAEVHLNHNQLTSLDVSGLPILQWLNCSDNQLTSLDVSQNGNLAVLWCNRNLLQLLTLPNGQVHVYPVDSVHANRQMRGQDANNQLARIECGGNQLESLDLAGLAALKELNCENNGITELDLADNTNIGLLDCDENVDVTLPEGMTFCAQMVVNDGEATYRCTSLSAAIDKITGRDGVTSPDEVQSAYITLFDDQEGPALEFAADQQKTVTIDLNGYTYGAWEEPGLVAYENDVTVINGEIVFKPTPAFRTHNLVLSGEIGVNFFMELPEIEGVNWENSYMTFTVPHGSVTERDDYDPEDKNSAGTYYAFTAYVGAIQMAEPITATFHWIEGEEEKTIEKTYAIKDYFVTYDEMKNAFDEETQKLIEATADYGHYTQAFLAGSIGWTLGEDYAEMDKFYTEAYDYDDTETELAKYSIECNKGTDIRKIGAATVLDSETAIRLMLTPVQGYTGTITATADGGKEVKVTPSGDRYIVEIPNIGAHELTKTYTVTITTANSEATVTLSALSYVKLLFNANTAELTRSAASAILAYAMAAQAYKAAQ
jgi:Leucine-rich repeat (LRR) protein